MSTAHKYEHGSYARYHRGCRCDDCKAAGSEYNRTQYATKRKHQPTRRVPVVAVAKHIARLRDLGMTSGDIARAAGVAQTTVFRIQKGHQSTTAAFVAMRILSVREPKARARAAVGYTRRVRALRSLGWTNQHIADAAGVNLALVKELSCARSANIRADLADNIERAYEALWNKLGPDKRTATMAAKRGWAPPLAWDDDTINDPKAEPQGIERAPVGKHEAQLIKRAAFVENVTELLDAGLTEPAILARLGINRDAFERRCYRAGRGDLIARSRPDNKHAREAS